MSQIKGLLDTLRLLIKNKGFLPDGVTPIPLQPDNVLMSTGSAGEALWQNLTYLADRLTIVLNEGYVRREDHYITSNLLPVDIDALNVPPQKGFYTAKIDELITTTYPVSKGFVFGANYYNATPSPYEEEHRSFQLFFAVNGTTEIKKIRFATIDGSNVENGWNVWTDIGGGGGGSTVYEVSDIPIAITSSKTQIYYNKNVSGNITQTLPTAPGFDGFEVEFGNITTVPGNLVTIEANIADSILLFPLGVVLNQGDSIKLKYLQSIKLWIQI